LFKGRQKERISRRIDELVSEPSCPFSTRLEAAIYVYMHDNGVPIHGGQEVLSNYSQHMASWLCNFIYMDVDRE
jgi:hypothetical protein